MIVRCSAILILSCTALLALSAPARAARFEAIGESFRSAGVLAEMLADIEQEKLDDAATRIDLLLEQHLAELTPFDDDGLLSITAWIDALPPADKARLAEASRRLFDAPARTRFEALRRRPDARPEHWHALAQRYRFTSIAPLALAEAAGRAFELGDLHAADCFFGLARSNGWTPDERQQIAIALGRQFTGNPVEGVLRGGDATASRLAASLGGYRGPIAYHANWYGRPAAVGQARYFPHSADGVFYVAAAREVLALKEPGQVVWRWVAPDAWARAWSADRGIGKGRGTSYAPAVFTGASGAQLIVVRQPRGTTNDFCLRGLRASDGKLLWSTERDPALQRISFAGTPALAGGWIYAPAVELADNSASLVLLALDLLSGRPLFKTLLGTLPDARFDAPGWDVFWEQTEPAVGCDGVYIAPNVGVAFAIDRFQGNIRWARRYDAPDHAPILWRGGMSRTSDPLGPPLPPPHSAELLRFRGTPQVCDEVVVFAPQDTPTTFAVERRTGRIVWSEDIPPAPTLIGGTGGIALYAGAAVHGIEAASGKRLWKFEPPAGRQIIGPPILVSDILFIPTADFRILTISPETGQAARAGIEHPDFRRLAASEAGKKALSDAMIYSTIAQPRSTTTISIESRSDP